MELVFIFVAVSVMNGSFDAFACKKQNFGVVWFCRTGGGCCI